eukprot:Pgem_evm1s15253
MSIAALSHKRNFYETTTSPGGSCRSFYDSATSPGGSRMHKKCRLSVSPPRTPSQPTPLGEKDMAHNTNYRTKLNYNSTSTFNHTPNIP